MRNTFRLSTLFTALCAALFLNACGGGDPEEITPNPQPEKQKLKFELLAGEIANAAPSGSQACRSQDGTIGVNGSARFEVLEDIYVTSSAVYLLEDAEDCAGRTYQTGTLIPETHGARIVKISGQKAQTVVHLHDYAPLKNPPMLLDNPSSLYVDEGRGDYFVLGRVAAPYLGQHYDPRIANIYYERNAWDYFSPGFFRFQAGNAANGALLAGSFQSDPYAGSGNDLREGPGRAAGFYAPHSLARSREGVFYFVDASSLRSVQILPDGGAAVKTVISKKDEIVYGVAADAQGNIHYIAGNKWKRLDGARPDVEGIDFTIGSAVGIDLASRRVPFAIVGEDMVLAGISSLVRYKPTGEVEYLTGHVGRASSLEDFFENPEKYALPAVPQAVHYGPDGHLYVLFDRGVLVARDFR